jgi:hypothetical protein
LNNRWASREFENLHALVHVGLVGFLMSVDLALAALLLGALLDRHLIIEEGGVHAAVELIHVHRVETLLRNPIRRSRVMASSCSPALVGATGV